MVSLKFGYPLLKSFVWMPFANLDLPKGKVKLSEMFCLVRSLRYRISWHATPCSLSQGYRKGTD